MKKAIGLISLLFVFLFAVTPSVSAGWVNGYYRSNGTYVSGYYRTEPNLYKWDNYSFDGDWSDSYNDNTYYRSYGYDPEPLDDDYISSYSRNSYYSNDDYFDYYDSYDYEPSYSWSDDWDWWD